MATLAVVSAPGAGAGAVAASASCAAGGDVFPNNGRTIVEINNGSGGSITPTFAATGVLPTGAVVASVATAIAAGVTRVFGPFPPEQFNNASGQVAITYSGVTSLTIRCMSIDR